MPYELLTVTLSAPKCSKVRDGVNDAKFPIISVMVTSYDVLALV